jgi:hypothetical protein
MAERDESDDHRLAGRTRRGTRPGPAAGVRPDRETGRSEDPGATEDDTDDQIDAVTRLMGFLRSTD